MSKRKQSFDAKKDCKEISYCKDCNMVFNDNSLYSDHVNKVHKINRSHTCFECKVSFKRSDHLKRHIASKHSTSNEFPCAYCKMQFSRRDHLARHMVAIHEFTFKFKCPKCPILYCHVSETNDEETNVYSEKCPDCDAKFKRRDHLRRHIKSRHLNVTAKCPVCPAEYSRRDILNKHLKKVHDITVK